MKTERSRELSARDIVVNEPAICDVIVLKISKESLVEKKREREVSTENARPAVDHIWLNERDVKLRNYPILGLFDFTQEPMFDELEAKA